MRQTTLTARVAPAGQRRPKARPTGTRQGQRRAALAGRKPGRRGQAKPSKAKARAVPKPSGRRAWATQPRRRKAPTVRAAGDLRAFVNARILPMGLPREGRPGWEHEAQALLWRGDTILAVGSDDDVRAQAQRLGIEPEDLGGRIVLPGFVDAHTHFLHVGVKRTRPDLRGTKSLKEALARLAAFLREHPGSHHVIGEGWDESEWQASARGEAGPDGKPRKPTRDDLDAVVAAAAKDGAGPIDRPVVLRRICGHIAVASSGALPLVRQRWDDDAAVDLRTGLLLEAPSLYLNEALPSTPAELDRAVRKACEVAHRVGVTTLGDYSQAPYRAALQRAAARGELSVRVASSVYVQQLDDETRSGFRTGRPALAPKDLGAGARRKASAAQDHFGPTPGRDGGDRTSGGTSAWLRDGGLKVFLDGSLGGHTAHLREPYLDGPAAGPDPHAGHGHDAARGPAARPGCGSRIWGDADLDRFFGTAHAHGVQVHAHAIGDAAVDQGLDAYARLAAHEDLEGRGWAAEAMPRLPTLGRGEEDDGGLGKPPRLDPTAQGLRHRFEHYEIVHDEQVARTVELGIVASSQPNFVGEWSAKGGMYHARLGDRYRLNNRFRDFLAAGVALAFGSDGMPFGPLAGLQSALDHPDPRQRLEPAEAVWHYTTAAAWSLHWEDAVGSLEVGKKADLLVLDRRTLDGRPVDWVITETIVGGVSRGGNENPVPSM